MLALKPHFDCKLTNQRNQIIQQVYGSKLEPSEALIHLPCHQQNSAALVNFNHYYQISSIPSLDSQPASFNPFEKLLITILTESKKHDFLKDINRKELILNGSLQEKIPTQQEEDTPNNRQLFYNHLIQGGFAAKETAQLAAQLTSQAALTEIFGLFKKDLFLEINKDGLIIDSNSNAPEFIQITPIAHYKFAIAMTTQYCVYPTDLMGCALDNNNAIFINLHFHLEIGLSTDFKRIELIKGYFIVSHPPSNHNLLLQPGYQALQDYHSEQYRSVNKDQVNKEFNALSDKFVIGYKYE